MSKTHQAEVAAMEGFNKEFTAGNKKLAMKDAADGSSENWKVLVSHLKTAPGFNTRVMTPKRKEHIEYLAGQIETHGFHEHEPLGGYVAIEDGQQVVYVTHGHNRLAAVHLLIAKGVDIKKVPFIAVPKTTTMADLTAQIVTGNSGMPLTTYEKGLVCKRLLGYGWETAEICQKLGMKSKQYVDNLLMLVGAPLPVREMVINEETSAENAIEAMRRYADGAFEQLQAGLTKAKASGKTRVTDKHMAGSGFKRAVKKAGPALLDTLRSVSSDPGFAQINPDLRAKLVAMLEDFAKLEASDGQGTGEDAGSGAATGGEEESKATTAGKLAREPAEAMA